MSGNWRKVLMVRRRRTKIGSKIGTTKDCHHQIWGHNGNGTCDTGTGVCKGVMLETQHVKIKDDFLPLELGSSDVILEMKWLATLDGKQVNWRDLTMKFQVGESSVTLQGDPSLSKNLVSMKSMIKVFKEHGEGVLLELENITLDFNDDQLEIPEALQAVLTVHEGCLLSSEGCHPVGVKTISSSCN
ncbi:Transposon Tf2-8 polyprotein [Abeliophyllum distichum]|uniref:Transposon Tf2-8 polyprotein n=1 Tax=Abeliophyllum distichum TaxID=126358 RepID=A0ABD1PBS3_9LAMI